MYMAKTCWLVRTEMSVDVSALMCTEHRGRGPEPSTARNGELYERDETCVALGCNIDGDGTSVVRTSGHTGIDIVRDLSLLYTQTMTACHNEPARLRRIHTTVRRRRRTSVAARKHADPARQDSCIRRNQRMNMWTNVEQNVLTPLNSAGFHQVYGSLLPSSAPLIGEPGPGVSWSYGGL